jgi:hypothetical protein
MSDDEIYGRSTPSANPPAPGQQAEGFDYPPQGPTEYGEEIMDDPWAENTGSDDSGGWGSGWFDSDNF